MADRSALRSEIEKIAQKSQKALKTAKNNLEDGGRGGGLLKSVLCGLSHPAGHPPDGGVNILETLRCDQRLLKDLHKERRLPQGLLKKNTSPHA